MNYCLCRGEKKKKRSSTGGSKPSSKMSSNLGSRRPSSGIRLTESDQKGFSCFFLRFMFDFISALFRLHVKGIVLQPREQKTK